MAITTTVTGEKQNVKETMSDIKCLCLRNHSGKTNKIAPKEYKLQSTTYSGVMLKNCAFEEKFLYAYKTFVIQSTFEHVLT